MANEKLYYLNPNIKKIGVSHNYTQEEVEEYIKCSKDPVYFIEKYIKIVSLEEGLTNFKLRSYQKRLIESYITHNKVITLQPRQVGKTISTAAFMLWYVLFHPDKTIAILANKAKIAREILDRVATSLENVPFFLQPGVKELNKGSIEFGNNSRIFADATSPSAIRGFSINLLYLDEFSHVENANEFFESVFPTISSSKETKIFISSTANGLNLYYTLWKNAIDEKNGFHPVEVKLSEVPGRDEEWQKQQIEILGERGFRQEYGNEFLGSANTLIAGHKLQELVWETPVSSDEHYTILEEPIQFNEENRTVDHTYLAVVDVSRGVGSDYSTITMIDVTEVPYRTVAIFRDNEITPIRLPNIVVSFAKKYNDAFILCERNSMGQQVADTIFYDYEYENIFSTTHMGRKGQVLALGSGSKALLGVEMTKTVKRIGTAVMKALIEDNKLIQFSEEQVLEMYNFISKNDSFQADAGKHDDLVMNLVLFSWAISQEYFKELLNQDVYSLFRDSEKSIDDYDVLPFGYVVDGVHDRNLSPEDDVSWMF